MASWTGDLGAPNTIIATVAIWNIATDDRPKVGTALTPGGADRWVGYLSISSAFTTTLRLADPQDESSAFTGDDLSDAWESAGSITLTTGTLSLTLPAPADMTEPYAWAASELDTTALTDYLAALFALDAADRGTTITIDDNADDGADIAPSFSDSTGEAQEWTRNTAITDITVPEADGEPTPTYAAVGSLPAGIAFAISTRVISGTPTVVGSGTITIRASNSEGNADWTVDYAITAPLDISDWDSTGFGPPIVLAVLVADVSGIELTASPTVVIATTPAADLVVASDLTVDHVERRDANDMKLRLRKTGAGNFSTYFDNEGSPVYPNAKLTIRVIDSGGTQRQIPFSIGATGGGFNNWILDNTADATYIDGIATGDRFILAIAEPPAAGVAAFEVRAGAPTVTISAEAEIVPVTNRDAAFTIRAGSPTVDITATAQSTTNRDAAFEVRAGSPTVAITAERVPPANRDAAFAVRAGAPRVYFAAESGSEIDAPSMLALLELGQDFAVLTWNPPQPGETPITGYDVRVGTGAWVATNTSAPIYRLDGLEPGTTFSISVRAVTSRGTGDELAGFTFRTLPIVRAGPPLHPLASPTGGRSIDLTWDEPLDDGGPGISHYEVCVINPDGEATAYEPTTGPELRWRVRGLALGHNYGFRVRAGNSVGLGPPSEVVEAIPEPVRFIQIPIGLRIPLFDVDRQSVILQLGNLQCRLLVWWQPSDASWYGSLDCPVNTPVVRGRRLAVGSGILDRVPDVLSGNIVCRALDSNDDQIDPARDAWRWQTHALVWEPV